MASDPQLGPLGIPGLGPVEGGDREATTATAAAAGVAATGTGSATATVAATTATATATASGATTTASQSREATTATAAAVGVGAAYIQTATATTATAAATGTAATAFTGNTRAATTATAVAVGVVATAGGNQTASATTATAAAAGVASIADTVTTIDDLRPGAYLQFVELTSADGYTTRLVDFADPHASSGTGTISFRGYDYTPAKIGPPVLEESTDGSTPAASAEILDPTYALLGWASQHGNLINAKMRVDLIRYEDIGTPSKGRVRTYQVREVYSAEGPPRLGISFGSPVLRQFKYPRLRFARVGCWNDYQNRFVHDGLRACTYPSDEFGPQTEQNFEWLDGATPPFVENDRLFGWKCANPAAVDLWVTNNTVTTDRRMVITSTLQNIYWLDAFQGGPYAYKIIPSSSDSNTNIDVHTKIDTNTTTMMICGLLIQPVNDTNDWLFWGRRDTNGVDAHLLRHTVNNVSTTDVLAGSSTRGYRIRRSGNTWYVYHAPIGETDESNDITWTLADTVTWAVTGNLRVGLAIARELAVTTAVEGTFYRFRFAAGGYTACDRSLAACQARGNVHQRNGYLGMPDAPATF